MRHVMLSISAAVYCVLSGCATVSNTPTPSHEATKSDAELIFAQEAGDLPAPEGPCPDRTEPGVLQNPRATVKRTVFGLAYCWLHETRGGKAPQATDTVKVSYSGWTLEGRLFDSSEQRGPTELALKQVIRGWTEALQLMTPGDKMRVWIPGDMAYGNKPPGSPADETPPKGPLIFEIELLEIKE